MSPMLPHFSDIVWPDATSYWIGNARVPLSLLAEAACVCAAGPRGRRGPARCADRERQGRAACAGRRGRPRPRPSICAAASSGRCWSTCTPISTAATPSCARPMSAAPSRTRSPRRRPTACAGPTRTCSRAWTSACAAPMRTASRRSAPISTRCRSRPSEAGAPSATCARSGRAASRCRPSR